MDRLLTSVLKEWRLLSRDRAGLLMLFLMPALLVIVVSVVQMNVLKTMGDDPVELLWVDRDQGQVARMLRERLASAEGITALERIADRPLDEPRALALVAEGDYQACLVVPPGLSAAVRGRAEAAGRAMLAPGEQSPSAGGGPLRIVIHFDPLAGGAYRAALGQSLKRLLAGIETQLKLEAFAAALPEHVAGALSEALGPQMAAGVRQKLAELPLQWEGRPLIALEESAARRGGFVRLPSAVQQNVPAWGLFGMFLISVPLSGALVRERASGIMTRLQLLPVSFLTLLTGKLAAYGTVCLIQFGLMLLVGRFVMPLFGAAGLVLGPAYGAIVVVLLCAALAAAAFGLFLGVATRTYEQASMIGAISVVIAAAIGGVMVPVFAMPPVMRTISQLSPLAWGLNAFLDLFARGGRLADVWLEAVLLLAFAALMLLAAWSLLQRQRP